VYNLVHSFPPSSDLTKPSAPSIAHDMASRIIVLEHAEDCQRWRQRPWRTVPMVSGLVLQKNRSDVELAHDPVLDDGFLQNGTITIFIVTVT
jgi:hypothetical protein